MRSDLQALRLIERPGGDGNALAAHRLKEQTGTARAAEPATHAGLDAVPLEGGVVQQPEVRLAGGGRRDEMAAAAPALLAVTADDVAQHTAHLVAHLSAHATAG